MTDLPFVRADPEHPAWRSPLARALAYAPPGIRDVSDEADDGALGPSAGIAGIAIEAPFTEILARLCDLEPPAIGALAGVRTQITLESDDSVRMWFPREYGAYMAEVVLDAWEGLA